jgi:hypothetical protein
MVDMTTTISQNIRPNHVAAIVEHDGTRLGYVVSLGATFKAIRKTGTASDIRRVGFGFRSVETAAAWIEASAR